MKRIQNIINQIKLLLIAALFSLLSISAFAQGGPTGPPPPPQGDLEGTTAQDNKLGGNAHLGGGIIILLTLGLAYGGKRLYDLRKEQKEEIV